MLTKPVAGSAAEEHGATRLAEAELLVTEAGGVDSFEAGEGAAYM